MAGSVSILSDVHVQPYRWHKRQFHGGIEAAKLPVEARIGVPGHYRDVPMDSHAGLATRLTGRYLFAGPLWNHFGHIFVDASNRLWPLLTESYDGVLFVGVLGLRGVLTRDDLRKAEIPATMRDICALLEFPLDKLMLLRQPMLVDELHVPAPGAIWKQFIAPWYRDALACYQARIGRKVAGTPVPEKLYYSRRHIMTSGGILGSGYFAKRLLETGFEEIIPERMPLAAQFAHLMLARQIVFDEGSSVHPTELLNRLDASVYMLPRRNLDRIFGRALTPRTNRFANLSPEPNSVETLPDCADRNSTAALARYPDPLPIWQRMADFGLVRGDPPSLAEYRRYEHNDLDLWRAKTPEIFARRKAQLVTARA
jgi:hypothetical protein